MKLSDLQRAWMDESKHCDELADVQTYLDILAFQVGVDLGMATMNKWNAVSDRVGVFIHIDADDWHYTHGGSK